MKPATSFFAGAIVSIGAMLVSCGSGQKIDEAKAAPPPANVVEEPDLNLVKVEHPERFALATAIRREELPELDATGVVSPDIERSIPVISLASGRVVQINAKLGDDVHKGQLLLHVLSDDISSAFATYNQAKADEELARTQLERAKLLYQHGAISLNDCQVAQDAEQKAKVNLDAAMQHIYTLGADLNHPDPIVNIYAPVSGTIVEQNVVSASGVHTPDNQPNLFTIADLSRVWVLCDVYENDLPMIRTGDTAIIKLNAYPDQKFRGRIDNIGKMLDPNTRSAKVRIVLENPGAMRAGMFVTATFHGQHGRVFAAVPVGAVLHLHDRDWVFVPTGHSEFRRTEITSGNITDGEQDVLSGIEAGQQVVRDALALSAEGQQ